MSDLADVRPGDEIPPWEMSFVDPARIRTMAAILRDPYPVHWDRDANAALGLPGRVMNQRPLDLGYIVNMLFAWALRCVCGGSRYRSADPCSTARASPPVDESPPSPTTRVNDERRVRCGSTATASRS